MDRARILAFTLLFLSWRASHVRADLDVDVCSPDQPHPSPLPSNYPMPEMAVAYTAGMLVNIAESNSSYELILGTDGLDAYMVRTEQGRQVMLLGDYRRKQLILMERPMSLSRPALCDALSLEEAAHDGQWLFGYDVNNGSYPHPNDPGWVFRFKEFDEEYVGKTSQLGIPCNEWQACKEIHMQDGTAQTTGVKFYWSDPDLWTPATGQLNGKSLSVPVKVELKRRVNGKIMSEEFIVFRYFDVAPPKEAFMIPPGVFCAQLSGGDVPLPHIPDVFSFDSEILLRKSEFETLIFYQKHFFDHKLNISRMEFSPLLANETIPEGVDAKNPARKMTQIHDFTLGLSYLVDEIHDICIVSIIQDGEEDVQSVAHSKVRMQNPLAFLKLQDINYTYYEERTERDIPAMLFMGQTANVTYEYYFSGSFVESEGEGMWTDRKPIKFSTYSSMDPNMPMASIRMNIFNFDVDEPEILQYDISACTAPEERRPLQFQLYGRYDIQLMTSITQFKHQILSSLVMAMYVSPLRIHDIQLDSAQDTTLVLFTLLAKQTKAGNVDLDPRTTESTSEDAIRHLRESIDAKEFYVGEPGGVIEFVQAIPHSLQEANEIACKPGAVPTAAPSQTRMPRLGQVFEAGVLVNVEQNKSSYELHFGVAGDKAFAKRIFGGIELTLIGDYNRKQLIEMTGEVADPRPRFCMTKSLEDAAKAGEWIFGYNTTGEHGRPHPEDPGWVFHFNDFQEQYMGKSDVLGIPCDKWVACQTVKFRDGHNETIGVEFYWSDAEKWSAATGANKSVPVKVVVSSSPYGLKVVQEYVFLSYSSAGPPKERFDIPQGVYCVGLSGENISVQKLPNFFSYDGEIIVKVEFETVIFNQKHYFDNILNLTRIVYKDVVDGDATSTGNKSGNSLVQVTKIHDFNAGLSYEIDLTNSRCRKVSPIEQGEEDVQAIKNGQVRMRNPMSYFQMEGLNLTYYEQKTERGIPAKLFMGIKEDKNDHQSNVYEYWFAAPEDDFDGEKMWTKDKPIKVSFYPVVDPDASLIAIQSNIFNFDPEEPEILDYDISPCTPVTQRRHFQFQLRGRYDLEMMPSVTPFKHQILAALTSAMIVSPLRVYNIELAVTDKNTLVLFQLLARNKRCSEEDDYDEVKSETAFSLLHDKINNNALRVGLPGAKTGVEFTTAISGSLVELSNPLAVTCNLETGPLGQEAFPMPTLPKVYTVGVLVTDALNASSYEMFFGTDGKKAFLQRLFGGIELTLIGDYDRQQLIEMTGQLNDPRPRFCRTKSMAEAVSEGQWMFGDNTTGENGRGHPDDPAWVFQFNAFNASYVGKEPAMGIPCNKWLACQEVTSKNGNKELVEAQFYWSDPYNWTAAIGSDRDKKPYSVLVRVVISRNGDDHKLVQEYNIFSFTPFAPSERAMEVPQGVFCPALSSENITIPTVPDFFSYDSEILVNTNFKTKALYQKHFFDHLLNLSRLDYSPTLDKPTPDQGTKPNTIGKITEIHDFNAGLSYFIDRELGSCVASPISDGDDVQTINKQVRMRNPMDFLQLTDVNYTYYEEKTERGFPANVYMGIRNEKGVEVVYEYWFTGPMVEIQGDDMWSDKKPIKFAMYPLVDPDNIDASVRINIFNFDVDEPEIMSYDISACTPPEQQRHLQFELRGLYNKLGMKNSITKFKHQILASLVEAMSVSPLRVHSIEVDTTGSETTTVYFTLLAQQPQKGNNPINNYQDVTSEEAIAKLRAKIQAHDFIVGLPDAAVKFLRAIPSSFKVLDDVACTPNMKPSVLKKPMPRLENTYTAGVLVNVAKDNSSYEYVFGTDGKTAYSVRYVDGTKVTLIGDYDRDQVIAMVQNQGDIRPRFCTTKNLEQAADDGDWIFGYNHTNAHARPHPDDPGWIFQFNDFTEQYIGSDTVMGIPCNRWDACKEIKFRDNKLELVGVKFYWSDPNSWTPASGRDPQHKRYSVPVKIEVSRRIDDENFIVDYDFFSYSNVAPPEEAFEIPQGVFCLDLKNESVPVPKVPDYFSFESEIIIKKGVKDLVFYQKHFFDDLLNLSRMEFSPLFDDKPSPEGDRSNNTAGELTQIHDFNAGLSYLVNEEAETCIVTAIDPNDEDVQNVSNSKVRMRNPMGFLKLQDVKYTYYQMKKVRDMPASQFMGLQKGDMDVVYEYWFSSPTDEVEGEGMWTTRVPVKFAMYPQVDPDNAIASVHTNIFNFDIDEPDILQYDISACTLPDQRRYLTFQLPVLYEDLLMPSLVQFKHQILLALVENMIVSPLRIHNIELDEHDNATTVLFTLLARPSASGNAAYYKANAELASDDAVKMLEKRMKDGVFLIGVPGGDMDDVKPVEGTLETLDQRPIVIPPNCPTVVPSNCPTVVPSNCPTEVPPIQPPASSASTSSGYSGSSMAGLGIGMVLLGLLLGGGGTYYYFYGFRRPR